MNLARAMFTKEDYYTILHRRERAIGGERLGARTALELGSDLEAEFYRSSSDGGPPRVRAARRNKPHHENPRRQFYLALATAKGLDANLPHMLHQVPGKQGSRRPQSAAASYQAHNPQRRTSCPSSRARSTSRPRSTRSAPAYTRSAWTPEGSKEEGQGRWAERQPTDAFMRSWRARHKAERKMESIHGFVEETEGELLSSFLSPPGSRRVSPLKRSTGGGGPVRNALLSLLGDSRGGVSAFGLSPSDEGVVRRKLEAYFTDLRSGPPLSHSRSPTPPLPATTPSPGALQPQYTAVQPQYSSTGLPMYSQPLQQYIPAAAAAAVLPYAQPGQYPPMSHMSTQMAQAPYLPQYGPVPAYPVPTPLGQVQYNTTVHPHAAVHQAVHIPPTPAGMPAGQTYVSLGAHSPVQSGQAASPLSQAHHAGTLMPSSPGHVTLTYTPEVGRQGAGASPPSQAGSAYAPGSGMWPHPPEHGSPPQRDVGVHRAAHLSQHHAVVMQPAAAAAAAAAPGTGVTDAQAATRATYQDMRQSSEATLQALNQLMQDIRHHAQQLA